MRNQFPGKARPATGPTSALPAQQSTGAGPAAAPTTRRRLLTGAAAAAALPSVLGACSREGGAPAAGGFADQTLTIALVGGDQQQPPAILNGFKAKCPKLTIDPISGDWNTLLDKVNTMLAAGTPPDTWYGEDYRAPVWGSSGAIRELTSSIRRDLKESENFALTVTKDAQSRLWAVPGDLQTVALFYNTAALTEAGVPPPTPDWKLADLLTAAQKLTTTDKKQYGFMAQPSNGTSSWLLWPRLYGIGLLDDTGTKSQFNSPKMLEAYQALMSLIDRGLSAPYADQGKYPFAPSQTAEGKSVMQFQIYARLGDAAMQNFTYDTELVPAGPGGRASTVIANSWVIAKDSKVPDASWEWLRWHSNYDSQLIRGKAGTGVPMNKKAAEDATTQAPLPPKNRRAFLKTLDFATPWPINAVGRPWRDAAMAELVKGFVGQVALPAALQEAHRVTQLELDKVYKR
jgi:multiple sugar transport system substrate-binding protein